MRRYDELLLVFSLAFYSRVYYNETKTLSKYAKRDLNPHIVKDTSFLDSRVCHSTTCTLFFTSKLFY